MLAMIPSVTGGWLVIMLLVALFFGALIGLILMGLLAGEKRLEECESCRYAKFYSRVMTEGKCPDCSKLWTSDLTTDGVMDGTGPLADFQNFHFGPEFTCLDRVEVPSYGWCLDNLVVSVPEPATWGLWFLGGGLAIFRSREKH